MRLLLAEIIHFHRPQCIIHALADFPRIHAQIFRTKGTSSSTMVATIWLSRVLKHHAHRLANLIFHRFIRRIHPIYEHMTFFGEEDRIAELGKG